MNKDFDYKKWEDQGWNNMFKILDRELPRKKKRGLLFYLTFFFSAIAMLWSFFSWMNTKDNANREFNSVQVDTTLSQTYLPPSSGIHKDSDFGSQTDKQVALKNSSGWTTRQFIKHRTVPDLFMHPNIGKSITTNTPIHIHSPNNKQELIEKHAITDLQEVLTTFEQRENFILSSLQLLPIKHVTQSNFYKKLNAELPEYSAITQITPLPIKNIQIGILAGTQYYTANNSFSANAGLILNTRLNNRWSVDISPSIDWKRGNFLMLNPDEYNYVNNNLDSLQQNTRFFSDIENFDNTSNPSTNVPGLESFKFFKTRNLYTFQLPILINYRLNNKLNFSFGTKFSIPLHEQILSSKKSIIFEWKNQEVAHWKLNPLNVFAVVGISYHPLQSLGISLNYSLVPIAHTIDERSDHGSISIYWMY